MSMFINILSPPGSNLSPNQKIVFDEIKSLIDSGTNELLMGPDWASNMSCCDRIRIISDQAIINESIVYLRRKLGSKKHMTVFLALSLVEAMVKNCGERIYVAINDEGFMKDFAKVVKKYSVLGKKGGESREVAELSADIMQAWGEAFLPRSKQYPNISRTYHELRKEGVPFKAQYDESRCPVFSPGIVQDNIDYVDSDLAAALQASIGFNDHQSTNATHPTSSPHRTRESRRSASFHQDQISQPTVNSSELVTAVLTTSGMLREIIGATTSKKAFFEDEVMHEVVQQLHSLVGQLEQVILMEVENGNEGVEGLFLANEEGTKVLSIFNDVKTGVLSYKNAKDQVLDSKPPSSFSSSSNNKNNEKKKAAATTVDLLSNTRDDFLGGAVPFQSPPPPAAAIVTTTATTTTLPFPLQSSQSFSQTAPSPPKDDNNFNAFDNWMAFDSNNGSNQSNSTTANVAATTTASSYHRSSSMSVAIPGPSVIHEDALPPYQRSTSMSGGSVLKPAIQSSGHKPTALLPPPQPAASSTRPRKASSQANDNNLLMTSPAATASGSATKAAADFDPFSSGTTSTPALAATTTPSTQFDPFSISGQSTDVNNVFGGSPAQATSPVKPAIAEKDILSLFSATSPMAMTPLQSSYTSTAGYTAPSGYPGQGQGQGVGSYSSIPGSYVGLGLPVAPYPSQPQSGAFPPAPVPPQQQQQQQQQYQTGLPFSSQPVAQLQGYPYSDPFAAQAQAYPQQQQQQPQYQPVSGMMYSPYAQTSSQPIATAQHIPQAASATIPPSVQSDNPFDFF